MILSTMICEGAGSPVAGSAITVSRYSGASRVEVVSRQTRTLSVSARKSDWITSAGRGFPSSPAIATVTKSPRVTRPSPPPFR